MEFDHVGIVTRDADGLAEQYSELLDIEVAHREELEKIIVVFLDSGGGYLELLEPTDDESDIGQYLNENGPGIHHIAIESDDAEAALDNAREMGVSPHPTKIDEEPRPGAWGHEVAFLDPADTGNVLLEFSEH